MRVGKQTRARGRRWLLGAVGVAGIWAAAASSTADGADELGSTLTPLGAEKAGNADGTIPPWEGGYTTTPPGYRSGAPRPDPFAGEQPLYQIDARNMGQHADKLSAGTKALLERFPSYRLDVYPTHRTAAAPAWVYDNTAANASRARTADGGVSLQGAYGGIPFPVPRTGAEAMWNHLLAWRGESVSYEFSTYVVTGGKPVLSTRGIIDLEYPYFQRDGALDRFGGLYGMGKVSTTAPPFRSGESFLVLDPVNQHSEGRKAWQYLVGQRRVRRAPALSYDNPSSVTSGFTFFDEGYLFNGALDRYRWTIVGKQEMFIPYNTVALHAGKVREVFAADHLDPASVRWELHRVWVVEGTLAPGKRHVIPRRRFYLDEDTWIAVLSDGWDANGQLWHVGQAFPFIVPELPAVVTCPYVMYDLQKGGYAGSSFLNEGQRHYQPMKARGQDAFSPAALAGEGIR